jgi:hypothetical protein
MVVAGLIDPTEFCDAVAANRAIKKLEILQPQIQELMGGLSNLHLEICTMLGEPRFRVRVDDWLTSAVVTREMVLREVSYCTGTSLENGRTIVGAVSAQILDYFRRFEIRGPGKALHFEPLGTFEYIAFDGTRTHFNLEYEDPAHGHYENLLIARSIRKTYDKKNANAIDVGHVFLQALDTVRPIADRRIQTIHTEITKNCRSNVDRVELSHILRRLFFNIFMATPSNQTLRLSVEDSIHSRSVHIKFSGSNLNTAAIQSLLDSSLHDAEDTPDLDKGLSIDGHGSSAARITLSLVATVGGGSHLEINLPMA